MEETNQKLNSAAPDTVSETLEETDVFSGELENVELIKEMMAHGLMYGHKKTKTNPKFKPFILTARSGIEIIDLTKTLSSIDEAAKFLAEQIKQKKIIILAATQQAAHETMENFAKKFNLPYVKNRWIGGLITNFRVIFQRLEYFKKTVNDMESGGFDKYTKKEKGMISKNIERMRKIFGGLENLPALPEVLFTIDPSLKGHATAIREAKSKNIPIVAIIDSDDDPSGVDYPIYANDHSKKSIDWVMNRLEKHLTTNN